MTSSRSEEPIDPRRVTAASSSVSRARSLEVMARLHLCVVGTVVVVALLWLLSDLILLVFAAILIACQLEGAARRVAHRTHLPYRASLALVVVAMMVAVGLFFWLHGPVLFQEVRIVAKEVNSQVYDIWQRLGDAAWLQGAIKRVQDYLSNLSGHIAGYAAGFMTSTLGGAGSLLLVLATAVYLAAAPQIYVDGLVALFPHAWRRRGREVLAHEGTTLRLWFLGQLVDMAVIGLLTGLGLLFLGVKLSLTLGLIAALCNFVPYIGALAGSVPAIVVGLSQGPQTAIYVAVLFVAVQTLEGYVIAPLIQRRTVDLPPVLTVLSQTLLGTLFGPFGLILATPITAATMVLIRMVYVETILGDREAEG